ncbi:unnamed protein product [Closterium sp. NIES-54]
MHLASTLLFPEEDPDALDISTPCHYADATTGSSLSAPPSDESVELSGPYPELVGCLMYLMTSTRPGLAYPLSLLARYVAPGRHRKVHLEAAKRVLRYLCSTSGIGLVLGGQGSVVLTGHSNASWADDQTTHRSTSGYSFSLSTGSVSWRSTHSSSVLSSSCEAEIYAGAMAAQELHWLTYLLTHLGERPRSPPILSRLPALVSYPAATTGGVAARATAAGGGGVAGSTGGAAGAGGAGPTTACHGQYHGSGGGFGFMWPQQPRDCASQRCVPGRVEAAALGSSEYAVAPGAGESAAALGARESANALGASASTATGPASTKALHTFTLDSGTSRCFFCDCTTVTPLAAPVPVSLADPTGGPVVARASTVFPCSTVPSVSLSGLHLPAFSMKLLSNAVLQDKWVDTFIPGGQRVAICKCSRTGRHLATLTRQPGSGLYTLTTASTQVAEAGQVAASSRVSASGQLAASCSCRVLSHQTLLWHHHPGHPSLSRLRSMHSRLLVSCLPRSLPSLPHSPAPLCLPCVEGRQRATPHSSEFPPTTPPLHTLHMDVWGSALIGGTDQERYFLLVVDDYTRYTTVFPLRRKADVSGVLIP